MDWLCSISKHLPLVSCFYVLESLKHTLHTLQHATADVSLMLLGSKSDLEGRREVTRDDAEKVHIR